MTTPDHNQIPPPDDPWPAPDEDTGARGPAPIPAPARPRTAWTADELMATDFPPPRWAVPGLLCEGVTLLAGAPKVGKSWMSLGVAVAVASGTPALGSIPVQQGPVLYLALEDTARRLKSRLGKVLGGAPAPRGLTLATSCAPLAAGGQAEIALWLDEHPDARLVVVDVLAKMRGSTPPGVSPYEADYAAIGKFKALADHYGVALVLVHHVRKMASEDVFAELSGTYGLTGAADAAMVLKRTRGTADAVLHITGRDIDETEHATAFDPETGTWRLLDGPAQDHALGQTRRQILTHLDHHPGSSPRQIADAIDPDQYDNIRQHLTRMLEDGQVAAPTRGRYARPGVTSVTTTDPTSSQGR